MSEHYARVIQIRMQPHPNADKLALVHTPYGTTLVVNKASWQEGEFAVHIEPDYEVDTTHKAFAWLVDPQNPKQWARVKTMKLRGVYSYGCAIPIRELLDPSLNVEVGTNVLPHISNIVRRYVLPEDEGPEATLPPKNVVSPKYNVEMNHGLTDLFVPGERVIATEKINGSSARIMFDGTTMHVGSHTQWKQQTPDSLWWQCLNNSPSIETFCRNHPGVIVYGEMYGGVRNFTYDCKPDFTERRFIPFDLLLQTPKGAQFANWDVVKESMKEIPWAPVVYDGPWDSVLIAKLARGNTLMPNSPNTIREGIVVRPVVERWDERIRKGRVILKFVSEDYYAL